MFINCTIKNYFKTYNEARGVALSKKKIIKRRSPKCFNYFTKLLLFLFCLTFLILFISFIQTANLQYFEYILIFLEVIAIAFAITNNIALYSYRKKKDFKSTILLNEEGLTDTSFQGIKMIFSWNKIKAVVIKKYSITILTDTSCYFYFDITSKEDIVATLKNMRVRT